MRPEERKAIELVAAQIAREEVARLLRGEVPGDALGALLEDRLAARDGEFEDRVRKFASDAAVAAVLRYQLTLIDESADRAADKAVHEKLDATVQRITTQSMASALAATRTELGAVMRAEVKEALARLTPAPVEVVLPDRRVRMPEANTHRKLPDLLKALHARCHVLLVGPAGTGKSMMAAQAALALELPFQALSLGPTTPMSKVFGYYDANGHYHDTPFRRAFEDGGVMLLDELDNGHPGLLGELNQALALRTCAFADGMVAAHEDFMLVATANTYGHGSDLQYVGRQALDAATLDRFVMIDVPVDEDLELRLVLAGAPSHQNEARRLLAEVRRLRRAAAAKRLPLVFSPRSGIDGAKLLEAGATFEQAMAWRVVRGLSASHRVALDLPAGGEAED